MADRPFVSATPLPVDYELTNVPSSLSAESSLSFTSATDISSRSFVEIERLSAAMESPPPPLSVMENTPLVRHSEYYMQDGMVEFQVSEHDTATCLALN